jgi:hypothetical protein
MSVGIGFILALEYIKMSPFFNSVWKRCISSGIDIYGNEFLVRLGTKAQKGGVSRANIKLHDQKDLIGVGDVSER